MLVLLLFNLINFLLSVTVFPIFSLASGALTGFLDFISSVRQISTFIEFGVKIFSYLLGSSTLFVSVLTISIVLMPIEILASIVWWTLGKLPFLNIQKK